MGSNSRSDLTSPFDAMLEDNRRQLERLYGGPGQSPPTTPRPREEAGPSAAPQPRLGPKAAPRLAASGDPDIEISRPGRTRTEAPGSAGSLTGSADGVAFSIGPGRSGKTG